MEFIQVIMPRIHYGHKHFKLEYTYHCCIMTGQVYNKTYSLYAFTKPYKSQDKIGTCFTIRIRMVSYHIYLITRYHIIKTGTCLTIKIIIVSHQMYIFVFSHMEDIVGNPLQITRRLHSARHPYINWQSNPRFAELKL